ncbi:hypothetical protein A5478_06105 [Legionella pneumophila]|nr:hypothetical protein A5478_06105 [Legionella pneumophila]ANH15580.1 hypothetical protein A5480_06100 [Legionella pneumophila]ANH18546.1 hypothetical protein A5479_06100 [Legionella pneumophila]APX19434.1 hypothetical protein A1D14_06115 [Legionella pneumophila]AQL11610.1 hypothetical protein A1D13_06115 [Legionella pneumophila]
MTFPQDLSYRQSLLKNICVCLLIFSQSSFRERDLYTLPYPDFFFTNLLTMINRIIIIINMLQHANALT